MKIRTLIICLMVCTALHAQTGVKKVYDESVNPLEQIDKAMAAAQAAGKRVICQVGGNWCPWCLRLADFIENDSTISKVIEDNFVYIHVNYRPGIPSDSAKAARDKALMKRLNDPSHYGFPVLVVLDRKGKVAHIQETGCLERDKSYDREKVLNFFNSEKERK